MSAADVVLLIGAILLGNVLVWGVILFAVRRRARAVRSDLEAELPAGVLRMANAQGFGLQSRGKAQVRGNGWLALTADELVFRQWVPRRDTRIARASITAVETPRAWLGKTNGSRLLCVRWGEADGADDAMAWFVRDLDDWLAALGPG